MAHRQTTDLSEIIENQRLTPFVIRLILLSTLVTFFDGFDMNVISLVAPEVSSALHLDKMMMGNVFQRRPGRHHGGRVPVRLSWRSNRATSFYHFCHAIFCSSHPGVGFSGQLSRDGGSAPGPGHRRWRPASAGRGFEYRLRAAWLPVDGGHGAHARLLAGRQFCRAALNLVRSLRLAIGIYFWWLCRAGGHRAADFPSA